MTRAMCTLAAAGLLLTSAACSRKEIPRTQAAAEPAPVRVRVLRVEPRPFTATVPVTGTLVSKSLVDVKAQTVGRVVRFDKEEGDPVAAGEVVVWVEEENYRLAESQALSAVQVSEAAVEKARVLEAHALSELERARNLVASGGITDRDLKAAEVAQRDARAQVALAEAQVGQAGAALEVARKHLRDTQVRAPVAGVIQRKAVNKGAYVEAPTPLFTIGDNTRLELESPVPSADLAPVRSGQQVTFTVNSYPGVTFSGRVVEISPAVEAESRAAKVRVRVDPSGARLKAGMFAQGEILTGVARNAIVIPVAAVYRDDNSAQTSYVFAVEDGKAARRQVRIGRERDLALEIVHGLKSGDALIAERSIEIADGVRVQAQ